MAESEPDWPTLATPGGEPTQPEVEPQQPAQSQPHSAQGFTITDLRRLWPDVLEEVKNRRRFTWILLSQNANVADLTNGTLVLAMPNVGARDSFSRGGSEDVLRDALISVIGADLKIETMVDPSAGGSGSIRPTGRASDSPASGSSAPESAGHAGGGGGGWGSDVPAGTSASPERTARPEPTEPSSRRGPGTPTSPVPNPPHNPSEPSGPPPWAIDEPSSSAGDAAPSWASGPPRTEEWDDRDAAAHRDDDVVDEDGITHTELLQQRLGAEIIAEEESGA